MKDQKTGKETGMIFLAFRPETLAFVEKAAKQAEISRAEFNRRAVIAAAEKTLGKKAPEVQPFSAGRGLGLIGQAAQKAGLSVQQLKSKLAIEALGGVWTAPAKGTEPKAPKAKKAKKAA